MIDHVSRAVRDLAASAAFYERLLAPLGYRKLVERPAASGSARNTPSSGSTAHRHGAAPSNPGAHVALRARARTRCAPFTQRRWRAAVPATASRGPAAAMTTYFGAFILDPDGNKLKRCPSRPRSGSDPEGPTLSQPVGYHRGATTRLAVVALAVDVAGPRRPAAASMRRASAPLMWPSRFAQASMAWMRRCSP
jgi:catechol 2,3-dioxygenase-like lactoylglutathione lyase family enzyme